MGRKCILASKYCVMVDGGLGWELGVEHMWAEKHESRVGLRKGTPGYDTQIEMFRNMELLHPSQ